MALDLLDVKKDLLAGQLLKLLLGDLDLRAALADDDARLCSVDSDLDSVRGALDLDLGDACAHQLLLQKLSDFIIFHQKVREILLCVPLGIPVLESASSAFSGFFASSAFFFSSRMMVRWHSLFWIL